MFLFATFTLGDFQPPKLSDKSRSIPHLRKNNPLKISTLKLNHQNLSDRVSGGVILLRMTEGKRSYLSYAARLLKWQAFGFALVALGRAIARAERTHGRGATASSNENRPKADRNTANLNTGSDSSRNII